jgi:uncharacterized protein
MKIAIIGAGISGLAAAHMLHEEHEITVFEAAEWIGGHTHTIDVATETGTHKVDTGFVVMNDRNYPNFYRLLGKLGVATQPSDMSFSVSNGLDYEYSSTSLAGLFAEPRHIVSPAFLRMLADVRRFQREAQELLETEDEGPSLGDYLEQNRYSREFIDKLIVPQASAVWSADPQQMWSFPARFLMQFFHNHGMLALRDRPRWSVVAGGSRSYVEALIRPFRDRVRAGTAVDAVSRTGRHVEVRLRGGDVEQFDRVILATHSDQALRLIDQPSDREHEILGSILYQANDVVLHHDSSLLPRRRQAWASWNYHLGEATGASRVTYHMNRLQSLDADRELCVTLNLTDRIDRATILGRWTYEHPVFTPAGVAAQRRRAEVDGVDRIHYCGAYWGWGFHEDGIVSAMSTCGQLGGRL